MKPSVKGIEDSVVLVIDNSKFYYNGLCSLLHKIFPKPIFFNMNYDPETSAFNFLDDKSLVKKTSLILFNITHINEGKYVRSNLSMLKMNFPKATIVLYSDNYSIVAFTSLFENNSCGGYFLLSDKGYDITVVVESALQKKAKLSTLCKKYIDINY